MDGPKAANTVKTCTLSSNPVGTIRRPLAESGVTRGIQKHRKPVGCPEWRIENRNRNDFKM